VEDHGRAEALDEPVHVIQEMIEEGEPAQFAVGDDVQADCLLHGDDLVHRPVFDPLELTRRELPGGERTPRLEKVARAEQRADDVGVERGCHPCLLVSNQRGTAARLATGDQFRLTAANRAADRRYRRSIAAAIAD
jgi:hypothetical protein